MTAPASALLYGGDVPAIFHHSARGKPRLDPFPDPPSLQVANKRTMMARANDRRAANEGGASPLSTLPSVIA